MLRSLQRYCHHQSQNWTRLPYRVIPLIRPTQGHRDHTQDHVHHRVSVQQDVANSLQADLAHPHDGILEEAGSVRHYRGVTINERGPTHLQMLLARPRQGEVGGGEALHIPLAAVLHHLELMADRVVHHQPEAIDVEKDI